MQKSFPHDLLAKNSSHVTQRDFQRQGSTPLNLNSVAELVPKISSARFVETKTED
jgi:hypothetical protein